MITQTDHLASLSTMRVTCRMLFGTKSLFCMAFIVVMMISVTPKASMAASIEKFTSTRMALTYFNFAGEKNLSFADSRIGYGLEASVLMHGAYFTPFVRGRALYTSATQNFLDSGTERSLAFNYYQGAFEMGFQLYVIPRRGTNLNIFIGASAVGSINYISLERGVTLSSLPPSDRGLGTGFNVGIGAELLMPRKDRKWSLFAEAQYLSHSTGLLGQSFNVGGLGVAAGVGW